MAFGGLILVGGYGVGGLRAGWVWVEGMVTGEVGLKKGTLVGRIRIESGSGTANGYPLVITQLI